MCADARVLRTSSRVRAGRELLDERARESAMLVLQVETARGGDVMEIGFFRERAVKVRAQGVAAVAMPA